MENPNNNIAVEQIMVVTVSITREILDLDPHAKRVFGDTTRVISFLQRPKISRLLDVVIASGLVRSMRCPLPDHLVYEMFLVPYPAIENPEVITIIFHLFEAWDRWSRGDENVFALTQEIIDAVADGIIIVDAKGIVRQTNKSYDLMANIQKEDYINLHVDSLVKSSLIHQALTPQVVKRREPISIVDLRNYKDLLLTGTPLFERNGEVICVLCNVRDVSELRTLKEQLSESKKVQQDYIKRLEEAMSSHLFKDIITNSPNMQQIIDLALRVAPFDSTILLLGESGVGKGVLANLIHQSSKGNDSPMVAINCGSIPPNLFESELFGYEAGAFTGASKGGKPGIFELADNSTLFLDEIGDLPIDMQVKVLQAIQDKKIMRIGGNKPINVNVRIIAATNRDLEEMIREKTFREDLYYRLNVLPIKLPPLRERTEDIYSLTMYFTNKLNKKYGMNKRMSPQLIKALLNYQWPGNIRELENTVERLLITSADDDVSLASYYEIKGELKKADNNTPIPLQEILDQKEKEIMLLTYQNTRSTRKSALILGIGQATFVRKAKKHGIPLC